MPPALLIADPLLMPGADTDMARPARIIMRPASRLDAILIALDTPRVLDIAQPLSWQNEAGAYPAPFTLTSAVPSAALKRIRQRFCKT
jgi:nicotinamidase/pyrazinamidase